MRFSLRTLMIVTLVIAVAVAAVAAYWRHFGGQVYYARRIERQIEELHSRCPPSMTTAQWSCMVEWTCNLHGNSLIPFQTTLEEISEFEARLEERLDRPVDASTIEWTWNEYAEVCDGGKQYQRFRLMVNEELRAHGSPVLLEARVDSR
ncbi:hypothetical protein Mal15_55200 [Stieleria maiorica]|uniref:Uncharacterized protein n=1 Tax=Stieleria maiorica TaxID=2795974 RepID=A0A5B9MKK8_9BACT|nr:hypothetical protein [Stieleria maiorica]QEG01444.1 hypothetical protein Mal15_55200 [Stieleria maiorica]